MKTNKGDSDRIFNYGGDEDSNLFTQDEQMDIDYFTDNIIPPLERT